MIRLLAISFCLLVLAACDGVARSGDGFYAGGAGGLDRAERAR